MNDKLLSIINSRQLVSVMNETKWRELCYDFENIQCLNICVRYKLIIDNTTYGFSPVWWSKLFDDTPLIEWLEFDPIVKNYIGKLVPPKETDRSIEILNILNKHSIKYSHEHAYIKIWGYISSSTNPIIA